MNGIERENNPNILKTTNRHMYYHVNIVLLMSVLCIDILYFPPVVTVVYHIVSWYVTVAKCCSKVKNTVLFRHSIVFHVHM